MSESAVWCVGVNGPQRGPISMAQVLEQIAGGKLDGTAHVYSAAPDDDE
jgi:hypothetical protein